MDVRGKIMRFIVVRHAESQWNQEGIIQGQLDSPVTANGHRQIAALMAVLKNTPVTQVISSPSGRAMTTAQSLAAHCRCSLSSDPRLYEQHFGDLQGLPYHQVMNNEFDEPSRALSGDPTTVLPGGESVTEVVERMLSFFDSFSNAESGTLAVVTHAHALQALIWQLQGANQREDTSRYHHLSCSYSVIEVGHQGLQLQTWGVATHLRSLHHAPI
jgi:probable phosphoglycerate mutase